MPDLHIYLFGRFSVRSAGAVVSGFDGAKVQELLAFLLLRRQTRPREALAEVLWGASAGLQARKALRQTLWQLQTALERSLGSADRLVLAEADWVSLNPAADIWLDVDVFERAQRDSQGVAGPSLTTQQATGLQKAVGMYGDGLLAGCYQEWCLCERERLEQAYIAMLDKLMRYAEAHQDYESGLDYGERILRCDRARERTHRRMMRLYFLAGDRTEALRQYGRCLSALHEELDVTPAAETRRLYEELRQDRLDAGEAPPPPSPPAPSNPARDLSTTLLAQLQELGAGLAQAQALLQQQQHRMQLLERRLRGQTGA